MQSKEYSIFRIFTILVLFLFSTSIAKGAFVEEQISEFINKGDILIKEGKYKDALEQYLKAYNLNKEKALTCYKLGVAYYFLNDYTRSVEFYKEAIKLDPKFEKALNNLAIVYEKLDRDPEALELYKKALELKPDYSTALFNISAMLIRLEKLDRAEEYVKKLMEIAPTDPRGYFLRGLIFEYREDYHKAEEMYLKCLSISAAYPEAARGIKRVKERKEKLATIRRGLATAKTIINFKLPPEYEFESLKETISGAKIISIKYEDFQDFLIVKPRLNSIIGNKDIKTLLDENEGEFKNFLKEIGITGAEILESGEFSPKIEENDEKGDNTQKADKPEEKQGNTLKTGKFEKTRKYVRIKCIYNGYDREGVMMVFRPATDIDPMLYITLAPANKFSLSAARNMYDHIEAPER